MSDKKITIWPVKPYRMILAGPSGCGKTRFLLNTLKDTYSKDKFDNILIFAPEMSINQEDYQTLEEIYGEDKITRLLGLPNNDQAAELFQLLEKSKEEKKTTLIIIDDLASKASSNKFIANITTAATHHLGVSMAFLQQTHFLDGSGRTARLNADYVVVYPMHADKESFARIARQIDPVQWQDMYEEFMEIAKTPFKPMIIDFHAMKFGWPKKYYFRSGWWKYGIEF
jgi:predicted AAA+ superfamily ATPase